MSEYQLHPTATLGAGAIVGAKAEIGADCVIGARARIGAAAVIHAGVKVGVGASITPGSVVTREVPAHAVVRGDPGVVVDFGCEIHRAGDLLGAASEFASDVSGVKLYRLPQLVDTRGSLTFGEFGKTIPFIPQRYFIVFDVPPGEMRGGHTHATCGELLLALGGSVAVVVDDGHRRAEIVLDAPDHALYLPPLVWGVEYKYAPGAMLLVLATHYYEPKDYIRGYDDFMARIGG